MAEVRAVSGTPSAASFAGFGAPSVCAPLVVDTATGDIFSITAADVVTRMTTAATSGTSAPGTTPRFVGQLYVDTTAKKLYFATGTASSSDWTAAN